MIILQHPRERNHPFGTERFARLGLRRVRTVECGPNDPESMARASVLPPNTALVYPSPDAPEVGSLSVSQRPDHIVLVDATWHQAKTIVRSAPWLRDLPRIRLDRPAPGEYRIRREPRPNYLSTIEATIGALRALEPDTEGLDGLMGAFRRMVDRQIERSAGSLTRRIQAPKAQRKPVSRAFTMRWSRLIVVYGEVATNTVVDATVSEVVYWCAVRPATGEVFARFVRPARATLNGSHIAHMGLTEHQILAGQPLERFHPEWSRFCGPDAIVAAWSQHSLNAVAPTGPSLLLKGIACNLSGRGCGHLQDFVSRTGLTPETTLFEGRAGTHMGQALAVVAHLRRLGLREK